MRPGVETDRENVYECFGCGSRERNPADTVCGDCGLAMVNITRSRDW